MPFPLLTALAPIVTGLLGFGGAVASNAANRRMAERQMGFQERMSSTAAQRSVIDYREAGLNPALAYGNTASSPGGSTAQMADVARPGIANAMQAAATLQQLKIAGQQSDADLRLKEANTKESLARGATTIMSGDLMHAQRSEQLRRTEFERLAQPHDLRRRAADALLSQLAVPKARAESQLHEMLGMKGAAIPFALQNAGALAGLFRRF